MGDRIPITQMLTFGLLPSCIKKNIYRLKGNKIGRNVKLSLGSIIRSNENFSIGAGTKIGFFTSIVADSVSIGQRSNIRSAVMIKAFKVVIGNDVTISEAAIIRAGHLSQQSEIIIDDLVHIFPNTTIDPSRKIHLMEECAVGPQCSIFTHGSYKNILEGYPVSYGNVEIVKRVELTYNVFVAPGVNIGDDAIIAYGSYVNKQIPSSVLAGGCPAKILRNKEDFIKKPTIEEQQSIVLIILNEFCSNLIFLKKIDSFKRNDNVFILNKGKEVRLITFKMEEMEVVLTDNKRGDISHYNLRNYSSTNINSWLTVELRRFFSRYGIRFKM